MLYMLMVGNMNWVECTGIVSNFLPSSNLSVEVTMRGMRLLKKSYSTNHSFSKPSL